MPTNSPPATPPGDGERRSRRGGRIAERFHVRPRTRGEKERDQNFWDRIAATKHWTNTLLRKIASTSFPPLDRRIHLREGKRFVPVPATAPLDALTTHATTPDTEVRPSSAEELAEKVDLIIDGIERMKEQVFDSTPASGDLAFPETDDLSEE